MATRSYGFRITKGNFAGSPDLTVKIMAREEGDSFPINCRGEGENEIWGASKKQAGLLLEDLCIHMWRGDYGWTEARIEYRNVYTVNSSDVLKMAKVFDRIEKAIAKAEAREVGDVLMAVCKALGLTWYVHTIGNGSERSSYRDNDWRFASITEGRDKLRALKDEIEREFKGERV